MRVWNPIRVLVAGTLLITSACGDSGGTTDPEGGFTISVSASTLNLTQGGTASFNVNVTRTGDFTGPVTVTIQGLPANVTATPNPATVAQGASSVTIELSATGAAAVASNNITVRAEGSGETRTQTVALSILSSTTPTFNLALNPTTVSIERGSSGTATATLTRVGGHNGAVAFSVSGAPSGMTLGFNPNNTTGNTSTITINVGQNVAVQNHTVTITATSGNITQNANLTVTVTGGSTGGGNVTYRVCSATPVVFAAVQDGTGNWQPATVTNGTVSFNIGSGRGGIAWVAQSGGQYITNYFYGTAAELNQAAGSDCATTVPVGTKSLTGSVAGLGLTESANITVGSGNATVIGAQGNTFTLNNVTDGATDAVAFRVGLQASGGGFVQTANRGIIRRNVNYTGTIPAFDFGAAESFALTPRTLTVNGLGGDQISFLTMLFMTGRGVGSLLHAEALPGAGSTRQIPTVPNSQAGDLHFVQIGAGAQDALRAAFVYFQGSADRSVTLGPAPANVTVAQAATSPSLRLRTQYTVQPEYNRAVTATYTQQPGKSVTVTMTRDYLNGSNFDHTLPELTGLTGYPAAAALTAGTQVFWSVSGFNYTGNGVPADGLTMTLFIRSGNI